jgi:hypothetical protein
VVEWCSFARTPRRFRTGQPSSAYRLLSDQLSDYGVEVPCTQAHIYGLSSRSVLDLDDSLTGLQGRRSQQSQPFGSTVSPA